MDDVLVVTQDAALAAEIARWAAAVGVPTVATTETAEVGRRWRSAVAVVVGGDAVGSVVARDAVRRDHVLVVGSSPGPTLWRGAVRLGAVAVLDPADAERGIQALAEAVDGRGEACVLALVGAVGGAGTSTLAATLARTAARRGLAPVLVDGDPAGGDLDLLIGGDAPISPTWDDLAPDGASTPPAQLAASLPRRHGIAVLARSRESFGAADPTAHGLSTVVSSLARAADLVLVDLGRATDPTRLDVVSRAVLTVLVVPEEVRAVAAARRILDRLVSFTESVAVVPAQRPGGVGSDAVARALRRPVLTRWPAEPRLRRNIDHGHGVDGSRSVRRAAGHVLDAVGLESS